MKRLVFNKFYGGISNDPNIGSVGSLFNSEGVEIRENSREIKLIKGNISHNQIGGVSDIIMGYNIYDNSHFVRIHKNGYITNTSGTLIGNQKEYIVDLPGELYNIGNLTTPLGNKGFIIGATALYKWDYDGALSSLGIYADNTTGVVVNGSFNSGGTGWTYSNWSFSGGQAIHTVGNTDSLSQTLTVVNGNTYRVEVQTGAGGTTGTCVVKIGGDTIGTLSNTERNVIGLRTTTSTSETISLEPSSDFNINIENVMVQQYNLTSQAYTFNEKAPFVIYSNLIYVGNGNKITRIDTTSSVFVIEDILTIDLDYVIKGITRIGDQFFIYASNGSSTRQYLWDGVNTTADRIITWVDKNCVNVANWANQDYILIKSNNSNKSGLYLVNGYQLQKIYENTLNNNAYLERIYFDGSYTNAIETIGNKLIIPGLDSIYSYGQFTPGLPYSLSLDYKHLSGVNTAMYYSEANDYQMRVGIYGNYNNTNGVYEVLIQFGSYNNNVYNQGFIEINPIVGECISNIKSLEKLTIGYKLEEDTSINIYTKNIDRTTKYANIYTTYSASVGAIYTSGGNTYTIYAITNVGNGNILHCTYTGTANVIYGTFTKTSGVGENTFYTDKVRNDYKYLATINDTTKRRYNVNALNCAEYFNEIQIGIELSTTNSDITPILNDINLYYNETTDD